MIAVRRLIIRIAQLAFLYPFSCFHLLSMFILYTFSSIQSSEIFLFPSILSHFSAFLQNKKGRLDLTMC
nr:MAG TPA: hypothetical protein [Caudoviricetes sp.]